MKPLVWLILLLVAAAPALAEPPRDRPGQRFHVKAADMPEPFITPSASNGSNVLPRRQGQTPIVSAGCTINIFAKKLNHARRMVAAPSGEVFLAQPRADEVTYWSIRPKGGMVQNKPRSSAGLRA